jgi:hypothetical protein
VATERRVLIDKSGARRRRFSNVSSKPLGMECWAAHSRHARSKQAQPASAQIERRRREDLRPRKSPREEGLSRNKLPS